MIGDSRVSVHVCFGLGREPLSLSVIGRSRHKSVTRSLATMGAAAKSGHDLVSFINASPTRKATKTTCTHSH